MIIVHPSKTLALKWQLLINELRLLNHKVMVTDDQYNADYGNSDVTMCEPVLMVSDDPSALAKSPLPTYLITDRHIDEMTLEIDETASTKTYTDLHFSIDAAIQLYRDKSIVLIRDILGVSFKTLVFKGHDSVLIMRESGNEYTQKPSAIKRLASLAEASKSIVMSGFETVAEEDATLRLKTCRSCPYMSKDTCLCCGCHVPSKTSFASSECPKGKWHAIHKGN